MWAPSSRPLVMFHPPKGDYRMGMTTDALIVLGTLAAATLLFVTEWVTYDVTAVLILACLVFSGILEPEAALSGFSNPATIAIASMLVLSEGLRRTGVLDRLADQIRKLAARSRVLAVLTLMGTVGVSSAFVNNTAVIAIFVPVVIAMAPDLGTSPSRLLMPLSFISIFGGVCTLVGTSTNLLVSSIAERHGSDAFSMFEMAPAGLVFFAVGFVYLALLGPRMLPERRKGTDLARGYEMGDFVSEIEVGTDHRDQSERDALIDSLDLDILEIRRNGQALHEDEIRWQPGDILRVRGGGEAIQTLLASEALTIAPRQPVTDDLLEGQTLVVCEVVVAPEADFVGRRLAEAALDERFGAKVLAVRHAGELRHERLLDRKVRAGDTVLLLIAQGRERQLARDRQLVVVSKHPVPEPRTERAWLTALLLAAAIGTAAAGLAPIAITALTAAAGMVIIGAVTSEEAYRAINWKIIVLLAGVIPLGQAMETSGAALWLAEHTVSELQGFGGHAVLGGLLVLTMVMTNLMTNVAAAAFLTPLAFETASALEVSPRPLVVAVMFGASLSFLSPIGYQTNTLVYGPGRYRYGDFARLGGALSLLCIAIGVFLIPLVWPFR